MATKKGKKTEKKVTPSGKVFITAGFNNTLITITDPEGNALFSGSAGKAGFKGSRKSLKNYFLWREERAAPALNAVEKTLKLNEIKAALERKASNLKTLENKLRKQIGNKIEEYFPNQISSIEINRLIKYSKINYSQSIKRESI